MRLTSRMTNKVGCKQPFAPHFILIISAESRWCLGTLVFILDETGLIPINKKFFIP